MQHQNKKEANKTKSFLFVDEAKILRMLARNQFYDQKRFEMASAKGYKKYIEKKSYK